MPATLTDIYLEQRQFSLTVYRSSHKNRISAGSVFGDQISPTRFTTPGVRRIVVMSRADSTEARC